MFAVIFHSQTVLPPTGQFVNLLTPQQVVNLLTPQQVVSLLTPQQVVNLLTPQQVVNLLTPQQVVEGEHEHSLRLPTDSARAETQERKDK